MPATTTSIPVSGTVRHPDGAGDAQLVLTERIGGYDTFLSGVLDIGAQRIRVWIISLDDVTVLRPVRGGDVTDLTPTWTGALHLPHGARPRAIPADLATTAGQRHAMLDTLDDAELRYALTFLGEATTTRIRQSRIDAIVSALPRQPATTHADGISHDG
jgi:hypothetical protein